jgi:hypothetical protein
MLAVGFQGTEDRPIVIPDSDSEEGNSEDEEEESEEEEEEEEEDDVVRFEVSDDNVSLVQILLISNVSPPCFI